MQQRATNATDRQKEAKTEASNRRFEDMIKSDEIFDNLKKKHIYSDVLFLMFFLIVAKKVMPIVAEKTT